VQLTTPLLEPRLPIDYHRLVNAERVLSTKTSAEPIFRNLSAAVTGRSPRLAWWLRCGLRRLRTSLRLRFR